MGARADGLISGRLRESIGTIASPRGFYQEIDDLADDDPKTDSRRKSGRKSHANDGQNVGHPGVTESLEDAARDMLSFGAHAGECVHDMPNGACSKHWASMRRRERALHQALGESMDHPWWTVRHKQTGLVLGCRRAPNAMRAIQQVIDDHNVGAHPSRRHKPGHYEAISGRMSHLPSGQRRWVKSDAASIGEELVTEKMTKEMRGRVSAKIAHLMNVEGMDQEQAVAVSLSMARAGRLGPGGEYRPVKESLTEGEFSLEMQGRIRAQAKKLMADRGIGKKHAVNIATVMARDGKLGKFGYRKPRIKSRMIHNVPTHFHHGRPHGSSNKPTKHDALREADDFVQRAGPDTAVGTVTHSTTATKINKSAAVKRLKVRKVDTSRWKA